MANRVINSLEEFDLASDETVSKIKKAVVAAALKIRDDAKENFRKDSQNKYKTKTGNITRLADGIVVKKNSDSEYVVTAVSRLTDYAYKTRFFVGGTVFRQTKKGANRGRIVPLETIDKAYVEAQTLLNQYINNAVK